MRLPNRWVPVSFLFVAWPVVALANTGTALMWAGITHLLVGNLVIGVGEGLLLARIFRRPRRRCVAWMILANYLSGWIGTLLLGAWLEPFLSPDLDSIQLALALLMIGAYLFTLVVECPFVILALRDKPVSWRNAVRGSLIVQSASYLLLVWWYWSASGTALLSEVRVVDLAEMDPPDSVLFYYLDAVDGDVYAQSLAADTPAHVLALGATNGSDRLAVLPSATASNAWDLVAVVESASQDFPWGVPVLEAFSNNAAPAKRDLDREYTRRLRGTSASFGVVPRLGDAGSSETEFHTDTWAAYGLHEYQDGRPVVHVALETPIAAWPVRNATHLPGDRVLFQFGGDRICLYDAASRKLALVARGKGPVAVLKEARRAGESGAGAGSETAKTSRAP